ncbi:BMP family lipoprotein [Nocardioides montaniterrae]
MRRIGKIAAVGLVASIALTACGSNNDGGAKGGNSPSASHPDFKACIVSDTGGFNDHSFNETALSGLTAAGDKYGITTSKVQSQADNQYADNLKTLINQKCDEITSVGFLLATDTLNAAKATPNTKFAIIDNTYVDGKGKPIKLPSNLKELTFSTDQPSFLAGYLAAGMSKSGTVATLGGLQIPTVTIFMDGFYAGVNQYNKDNGKNVKVLGWDGSNGAFSGDFGDTSKCKAIAQGQIQQGADIVFPVAGGCGAGALEAAKSAGDLGIWVDSDGYDQPSLADYKSMLLTSVVKRVDNATTAAIGDAVDGKFNNTPYVGTLQNSGVGLAPFHDFDSVIPQALKDKLDEYKSKIIDGSYTVK